MTYKLKCSCGKETVFEGDTIPEIIDAVDASGWVETPGACDDYCPECAREEVM